MPTQDPCAGLSPLGVFLSETRVSRASRRRLRSLQRAILRPSRNHRPCSTREPTPGRLGQTEIATTRFPHRLRSPRRRPGAHDVCGAWRWSRCVGGAVGGSTAPGAHTPRLCARAPRGSIGPALCGFRRPYTAPASYAARGRSRKTAKKNGDPGAIRTRDPQLRRLVLYPAELPGHLVGRTGFEPVTSAV